MFPTIEVIETPGRKSLANIIGDMMATNNVEVSLKYTHVGEITCDVI
jgi:hypothetical protein